MTNHQHPCCPHLEHATKRVLELQEDKGRYQDKYLQAQSWLSRINQAVKLRGAGPMQISKLLDEAFEELK